MRIKTSELTGPALDWAVATAIGLRVEYDYQYDEEKFFQGWWQCGPCHWQPLPKYSSDWAHGGPIIERQRIYAKPNSSSKEWRSYVLIDGEGIAWAHFGPTPLIAAMRCYVASKFGDEVDVPEALA
jgi:hypothetical protein